MKKETKELFKSLHDYLLLPKEDERVSLLSRVKAKLDKKPTDICEECKYEYAVSDLTYIENKFYLCDECVQEESEQW